MISGFPRASIGDRERFYIAGSSEADVRSFLYVPPSNDVSAELGPVFTCGQGIASGFEARASGLHPDAAPKCSTMRSPESLNHSSGAASSSTTLQVDTT